MGTKKERHLHPHNYFAHKRIDWKRTRTYQYVRYGDMNKDFYKGHFNDRWLTSTNEIHFVKIAGRSRHSTGKYNSNYCHYIQARPWEDEETRPSDDKIQNIFSHRNGGTGVSFYQKGSGLDDWERKKTTVYMMTGDNTSGLNLGRQCFDLGKAPNDRYVLPNSRVSNVLDDRTLSKYHKNVIGFSCNMNSAGSNDDTDNTAVVSRIGLLYVAFQDDGSPYLDQGYRDGKNNIFCIEMSHQKGPHPYSNKPGSIGETRYLTYTMEKADWDELNKYKHMGRHGNGNRSYYHWIGVVIEWHQFGKGSIAKTKSSSIWDFTPIISDNWSSLSTGQTSTFTIPQNFHTLGVCKDQVNVDNWAFAGVKERKKTVGEVHSSDI